MHRATSMKTCLISISLLCLTSFAGIVKANNYEELIIFGDSLSDTGNLASVSVNFPFPFFQNRISDGPLIVDFLAAELGLTAEASKHASGSSGGNNFAVAGGNLVGSDIEDLTPQVSAYLARSLGEANVRALYFVMMGGNDLRDIRSETSSLIASNKVNDARDQLIAQLNRLYDAGARAFMISNVANVGRIPETLNLVESEPGIVARAEQYVSLYNQRLSFSLSSFANRPGVTLSQFDLFAELESIAANTEALGFTQTEVGCFTLSEFDFHPDCLAGTRFDRFVFFDNLHPTSKTNKLVGDVIGGFIPPFPIIVDGRSNRQGKFSIAPIVDLLISD